MKKIVLASGSPRRKELMTLAGYDFEVRVSDVDESLPKGIEPSLAVEMLSRRKALASLIPDNSDEIVLAADTVVALNNLILGKPKDYEDAKRMLCMLSGNTHSVFTGVTVIHGSSELTFSVKSDVTFYELTDEDINYYLDTGEPFDKAGAYGIQGKGSLLIERIDGDYFNIVGLPIAKVSRELKKIIHGVNDFE